MSALPVLGVIGAIFVIVVALGSGALSLAARLGWRAPFVTRQTAARAAAVFAPALVASLVCVALISAAQMGGCHCAVHDLHHPHLCLSHPPLSQPLFGAAAWILAGWSLVIAPRLIALARGAIASSRWTHRARRITPRSVDGIAVRLVDCSDRIAFTIGVWSPLIFVDRELWRGLSHDNRRAVVHHEAAHAARRDGLTLLALRLCHALCPIAATDRLIASWGVAAEMCCDRHAANVLGDETVVAEALIAVERARGTRTETEPHELAMAMASHGSIAPRVMALLEAPATEPAPSSLGNDALAIAMMASAAAAVTWVWPGDAIHHGVETLAGLVSHLL